MAHDDFINMIHEEHEMVMDMLEQIKQMPDSNYTGREEMFNKLKSELVPHMKGEEKAFYPVLRKHREAKEDALEALEEHHIAEVSMMELDRMSKQEEFWGAKLSVFKELIEHHIEEEESKVFKDARDYISHEQMQEILSSYQAEKQSTKEKVMSTGSM